MSTDLLLVVPLREEYEEIEKVFPQASAQRVGGLYAYSLQGPASSLKIVATVLGEMGPTPAAQKSERIVSQLAPRVVCVLGLAGGLDAALNLGDVVIADQVDDYLAASKAVDTRGGISFELSGRSANTSRPLVEIARNFRHAAKDLFEDWRESCAEEAPAASPPPSDHFGHVACGSTVSSSKAFVRFPRSRDRKYLALEMESSGVAEVTLSLETPLFVLRGVSDFGDAAKKALEKKSKGLWRRYSVRNAALYLRHLLQWADFESAIRGPDHSSIRAHHEENVRRVVDFIKRRGEPDA